MEPAVHTEPTQAPQTERRMQPERRAAQAGREAAQAVKEQASAIAEDAKRAARSRLDETQQEAARGIGDFAGALRHAAEQVEGGRQATAGRLAQTVADGLDQVSERLRSKDAASMLHDVESFARRQPVVFLAAAFTAGFFAVRFLKSSADGTQPARSNDSPPF